MKVKTKTTKEVTISMNIEDAQWLMNLMHNPINSQGTFHESDEQFNKRNKLWCTMSDCLNNE